MFLDSVPPGLPQSPFQSMVSSVISRAEPHFKHSGNSEGSSTITPFALDTSAYLASRDKLLDAVVERGTTYSNDRMGRLLRPILAYETGIGFRIYEGFLRSTFRIANEIQTTGAQQLKVLRDSVNHYNPRSETGLYFELLERVLIAIAAELRSNAIDEDTSHTVEKIIERKMRSGNMIKNVGYKQKELSWADYDLVMRTSDLVARGKCKGILTADGDFSHLTSEMLGIRTRIPVITLDTKGEPSYKARTIH